MMVPRALNDTKKIRKVGAAIFANVWAENHGQELTPITIRLRIFPQISCGFCKKRAESTYKRLGPVASAFSAIRLFESAH